MTATYAHFHIEYLSDCLHVRAIGRYIIAEKEAAFSELASLFKAQPIKGALVDLREVPGPFTFMDKVGLGEAAGKYLAGTPIATLVTESQVDPERIGRLVARNRGANVEVFLDPAEGLAWLQPYLARE